MPCEDRAVLPQLPRPTKLLAPPSPPPSAGYLWAALGTLVGSTVGTITAAVAGLPAAIWIGTTWFNNEVGEDADLWEAIGGFVFAFMLAASAFLVLVVAGLWFGSVIGCAGALRSAGHDYALRTALVTGAIGPWLVALSFGVQQLLFDLSEPVAWLIVPIAAACSGVLARWLVLHRIGKRPPVASRT